MKNPYQEERDLFRRSASSVDLNNKSENTSPNFPPIGKHVVSLNSSKVLRTSKQQYQDFLRNKSSLDNYNGLKNTKSFINKRDRIMKNGFRHGVVGVENPKDPDSEVYLEMFKQKSAVEHNKEIINRQRRS